MLFGDLPLLLDHALRDDRDSSPVSADGHAVGDNDLLGRVSDDPTHCEANLWGGAVHLGLIEPVGSRDDIFPGDNMKRRFFLPGAHRPRGLF